MIRYGPSWRGSSGASLAVPCSSVIPAWEATAASTPTWRPILRRDGAADGSPPRRSPSGFLCGIVVLHSLHALTSQTLSTSRAEPGAPRILAKIRIVAHRLRGAQAKVGHLRAEVRHLRAKVRHPVASEGLSLRELDAEDLDLMPQRTARDPEHLRRFRHIPPRLLERSQDDLGFRAIQR